MPPTPIWAMTSYGPSRVPGASATEVAAIIEDAAGRPDYSRKTPQGRSSVKLSAAVKEAVADAEAEISLEKDTQACSRAPRSGAGQDGRPEQSDLRQWTADLRPRDSRVRGLVLFGPCLAFNRTVVLRYRIHLEHSGLAPATINLRLAAVRRIAYEAADAGLLSPELAAGIRRVKGVRRIGVRLGNWLTPEQSWRLLFVGQILPGAEVGDD